MSFLAPAYIESSKNAVLPIIHDLDSQLIQGGIAGQHYHLTLSELQKMQVLTAIVDKIVENTQRIYEPAMLASGDINTLASGDIVMASVKIS